MIRIGLGYDVHRLEAGRTLMLGGVLITREFGPVAHSDGDVLLHSLCDALLGAIGEGDIGVHFSDTQAEFKGIESLELLRRSARRVRDAGYSVVNTDATLILEKPKIRPFVPAMREEIGRALGIDPERVSIKATTSEGLGFIGEGRGIAAHAVVLLEKYLIA